MTPGPGFRVAGYVLLTSAVAALFLTTPWHNDLRGQFCVRYVRMAPGVGFPFNCDSPEFLRVAEHPGRLLEPRSPRQSRPLYPLAAAVLGRAVTIFTGPAPCPERTPICRPYHAAYVVLNLVVLVVSLALFQRLLSASGTTGWPLGAWMLALGLIANEVVKVFFWTPHTQMFSVLGPLVCVAAAAHALERPLLAPGPAVALGVLAGAESLAYGTFLLVPVCFALGALAAGARTGRVHASLGTVAAVLAGFAAPLLGWYLTVVAVAGSFYSDETARFGHLVWVAEAIADGAAAFELRSLLHLRKQLAAMATADAHVVVLLAVAASLAMLSGVRRRSLAPEARRMLGATGIALSLLFLFLTLLGTHPTRLAWSIVPPMLVATGVLLGSARERLRPWERRALDLSLSAWSIAWLVWEMRHGYPLA